MSIAFAPMDFLKAPYNSLAATGHSLFCCAITVAVNMAAHKVLDVKEKTYQSNAIKIGAFFVGVSVSLLLPSETLFSFTQEAVIQLFIVQSIISIALTILSKELKYLPLAEGALLGFCGPQALVPIGALGAYFGTQVPVKESKTEQIKNWFSDKADNVKGKGKKLFKTKSTSL